MRFARRLGALAALAALALTVAGCGGGRESAGHFVARILREESSGQWAAQWTELHPGQYVLCSERMNTDVASGKETYVVHKVQTASFHEQGVPEKQAQLVTISVAGKGITATFKFHAILRAGRWRWVLGPTFLEAISQGECLDGTPLSGESGSA